MPRNFLTNRSLTDLASEFVLRTGDPLAPVKLYSTADIYNEMRKRCSDLECEDAIFQATKVAQILGM